MGLTSLGTAVLLILHQPDLLLETVLRRKKISQLECGEGELENFKAIRQLLVFK